MLQLDQFSGLYSNAGVPTPTPARKSISVFQGLRCQIVQYETYGRLPFPDVTAVAGLIMEVLRVLGGTRSISVHGLI